jgi:hypothetical protein
MLFAYLPKKLKLKYPLGIIIKIIKPLYEIIEVGIY